MIAKKKSIGPKRESRPKWSDVEIENILSTVTNRTKNAIRVKKNRLGLRKKRKARDKWSKENVQKLQEFKKQGLSAQRIHLLGLFKQSKNAIQKKLCRIQLVKKNTISIFPMEIKQKFIRFLINQWAGKTPSDLMEIWNKENFKHMTNKRRVAAYLSKLNIKISCWEVQKINNLRKKELKICTSTTHDTPNIRMEKIRKERIELMKERMEKSINIWTGLVEESQE